MNAGSKPAFGDEYVDEAWEFDHPLTEEEVDALIQVSREAQNPHVALEYAQRAADTLPDHPQVQESVQRSIFMKLKQDAFVAFVAESTKHYVIRFRNSRPVVVPKARTHQELFPALQRSEGERVLGLVWWVALGLVPAGVGALLLSPLVVYRALYLISQRGVDAREKRMAWMTVLLAGLLGLAGAFFTFLLILHVIG
jgi:hypothetical protein